jgi:hypothetical protein
MRELSGFGRLVKAGEALGLECTGLRNGPAAVQVLGPDGQPVADTAALAPHLGSVLAYSGMLFGLNGENINALCIQLSELFPGGTDAVVTPMFGVFTGNLGQAPSLNDAKSIASVSMAIASTDDPTKSCWLRLAAASNRGIAGELLKLESGAHVMAFGTIETYAYKSKKTGDDLSGLQLNVNRICLLPRRGDGQPKPLLSVAMPIVDAFTAAA